MTTDVTLLEKVRRAPATVPTPAGPAQPPRPQARRRARSGPQSGSWFALAGSALSGGCVALLLVRLTAVSGILGEAVLGYVAFLAVYATSVALSDSRPAVWDAISTVLMTTAAVVALGAVTHVVVYTVVRGWAALVHTNFYTQDMSRAGPLQSLRFGGMGAALVGTLWQVGIATVATVPLGLVAAVYLDASKSRLASIFRTAVEAMTALPSILAGLFIFAFWILTLGFQRSGLAAALALSVMMLPYIIRAGDLSLRLVSGSLREASAALGAPGWRTEWSVVLPTARSGLATAVILGVARAIGEASPVLLTAGYTTYVNANPLTGSMVSLPLSTLKLVQTDVPNYTIRAFGMAAFLLVLVVVLFAIARKIGGWGPDHVSRRRRRVIARTSAADVRRMARLDGGSVLGDGHGRGRRPARAPRSRSSVDVPTQPPTTWQVEGGTA